MLMQLPFAPVQVAPAPTPVQQAIGVPAPVQTAAGASGVSDGRPGSRTASGLSPDARAARVWSAYSRAGPGKRHVADRGRAGVADLIDREVRPAVRVDLADAATALRHAGGGAEGRHA